MMRRKARPIGWNVYVERGDQWGPVIGSSAEFAGFVARRLWRDRLPFARRSSARTPGEAASVVSAFAAA